MDSTQSQSGDFRSPDRWNSVQIPAAVALRAYAGHTVNEDGCWISVYSATSRGYAQVGWHDAGKTRMVLAHRASWVHINGQMPVGMTLDHTCHTKRCVNPDHLRLLTNEQNARRGALDIDDVPIGECLHGHGPERMLPTQRMLRGRSITVNVCRACKAESYKR